MKIDKVSMDVNKVFDMSFGQRSKEITFCGSVAYNIQDYVFDGSIIINILGRSIDNTDNFIECSAYVSETKFIESSSLLDNVDQVYAVLKNAQIFNIIWVGKEKTEDEEIDSITKSISKIIGFNIWDLLNDIFSEMKNLCSAAME